MWCPRVPESRLSGRNGQQSQVQQRPPMKSRWTGSTGLGKVTGGEKGTERPMEMSKQRPC